MIDLHAGARRSSLDGRWSLDVVQRTRGGVMFAASAWPGRSRTGMGLRRVDVPALDLHANPIYYSVMGALVRVGYARLDNWISENGDGGVMNEVCSRVAEGETLKGIARTVGMPYSVLWNWLQGEGRMELYRQAKEAAAEALADEVLSVADTSEVVRDRVDARKWLAGKWARQVYGEKADADQKVGITVIVQRDGISYEPS